MLILMYHDLKSFFYLQKPLPIHYNLDNHFYFYLLNSLFYSRLKQLFNIHTFISILQLILLCLIYHHYLHPTFKKYSSFNLFIEKLPYN
jgi:hypothetical protein